MRSQRIMPEPLSRERDRAAVLQCRRGLADTHARLSLLDLVVSRLTPLPAYAAAVGSAREHLEAALVDLDAARIAIEGPASLERRVANG
jgi:hypothetical protein